jgi:malate dehydrogenase (oxaloacetate-decarboxylating)(NADP+)
MIIRNEDALEYHASNPAGKLAVRPTKPCSTQRDLSLAYTPGVAVPCLEIHRDPSLVYRYTGKGNLVAVVTNGTAVLGLGNIGPAAGKPVMEGKGVLFKRFADIDVFDIELATDDPNEIIRACQMLEPTFGGINLEDIKAPECFLVEEECRRTMKIPVFHDDQHGTAIISGAALLNALELTHKRIADIRVVFNGAGASGIACAQHYLSLGVRRENILMCDTSGVIYRGRTKGMNEYKARFAADTEKRTLEDAFEGADVFFGLSAGNVVTPEMVKRMAPNPIIFALANPDPEIAYDLALQARPDAIVATGRSDFPNQVNNVLGFPFIFRGALDVRATTINDEMKLAATHALALLAREDVPDSVRRAYGVEDLQFGHEYIIPKPFDPRVLVYVSTAVAEAAVRTGVAQQPIDVAQYREDLERRLGKAHQLMRIMIHKAQANPKRVVFPEGEERKILRACHILQDEKIAIPILLGNEERIRAKMAELHLQAEVEIIDPATFEHRKEYARSLHDLRSRKGITLREAQRQLLDPNLLGAMMVRTGFADALIGGLTKHYPETIRPALQVIELLPGVKKVAGCYVLITTEGKLYFLADTTVNIEPTAEDLAEIALLTADTARQFDIEPRIALLSFSNFGSSRHPLSDKVRRAVEILHQRAPEMIADGEMQADTAIDPAIIEETYPFSTLRGGAANVLIFPNLEAGNVAYKLLHKIDRGDMIGPILMGLSKAVHVLQRGAEVAEIVNMAAYAVVDAQDLQSGADRGALEAAYSGV